MPIKRNTIRSTIPIIFVKNRIIFINKNLCSNSFSRYVSSLDFHFGHFDIKDKNKNLDIKSLAYEIRIQARLVGIGYNLYPDTDTDPRSRSVSVSRYNFKNGIAYLIARMYRAII